MRIYRLGERGGAMPTEKGEENVILFTKEQFNAGLRFPLPALFKEFLHFSQIPPIFIHPNLVRVLMGCSIINMLYNLDLTLLESCQIRKGRGEGAGGGLGWMGGAIGACVEAIFSKLYLKNSGSGIEGPPCGLGGKGVLRLKLPKDEIVPGEHYTVKELPLYQEAKEADAERRRKLLEDRDQRKNEGTIRKAPGQKRGPDSPPKKTPAKRRKLVKKNGKDRPRTHSGLNHSGTSLAAVARLANVAEEAASINRPGNLNPDADAAETTPLEEAGAESQSQPSDDPDRLAIQEIEVSCASAHDAHPDGGEVEMATETSAAPAIIPAEDASGQMRPDEDVGLVRGLRGMAQQHDLFTQLLQTADYMKTFSSRRQEIENQLRLRMEEAEASLSTMREENEALRVELAEAKSREESTAGRLHEAEELEREFAVEREELAADYQQQVDDTFIFGYRCCMKKNGIKRDTPSIPPGEEKKLHEKPAP
ncbi:hypothetical protein CK203_009443 [Vitis vinifera]|uniref:Uncharacterized protein n=1 Tax=Vitis vinifera TaxID=29760 RepID=A0A438JS10_VITVI|nr:hypothetical protein CK203_009443 [Vitis vinifera]